MSVLSTPSTPPSSAQTQWNRLRGSGSVATSVATRRRADCSARSASSRFTECASADICVPYCRARAAGWGERSQRETPSAEQGVQLAPHGLAQPVDVLVPRADDGHPEAVERGDHEPDVELRRRRGRVLEHALTDRAQPLPPVPVDLARAVRAEQLDLQAIERHRELALAGDLLDQ